MFSGLMPFSYCSIIRSSVMRLWPTRNTPPASTRSGGRSARSGSELVDSSDGLIGMDSISFIITISADFADYGQQGANCNRTDNQIAAALDQHQDLDVSPSFFIAFIVIDAMMNVQSHSSDSLLVLD